MELRQLRYFVRIAELGSMSRAARALHIAQPSLSQQIAQLEDELGRPLLIRVPTGVRLTCAGEAFCREVRQVLRGLDRLKSAVAAPQAELTGKVSFGMTTTQSLQHALPLLVEVHRRHPQLQLEIFDTTSNELLQGLASGRHDLGLVINDEDASLLDAEPLLEEELFLCSHRDQAPARDRVTLDELAALPLALPGPGQVSARLEEALAGTGGSREHRWLVANSVPLYRQAVLQGLAHAVQPWGVLQEEILAGRVVATPFRPPLLRTVHLCSARGASLGDAARAVRSALLDTLAERCRNERQNGLRLLATPAAHGVTAAGVQ